MPWCSACPRSRSGGVPVPRQLRLFTLVSFRSTSPGFAGQFSVGIKTSPVNSHGRWPWRLRSMAFLSISTLGLSARRYSGRIPLLWYLAMLAGTSESMPW